MSRRISPRLREQAAVVCAQMATWWTGDIGLPPPRSLGAAPEDLATEAFLAAHPPEARYLHSELCAALYWAEAEAMLRTGWTP